MDTTQLKTKVLLDYAKKNKQLLHEWSEKTVQAFLEQSRKFTEEMYQGNLSMVDDGYNDTQEQLQILENLFKNFTKTKGDIQHKLRISYSIARRLYMENLSKRVFQTLRQQVKYQIYIRRMKIYASTYSKLRIPRQVFSKWRKLAHNQTRQTILHQVNRKTDNEIMQMQKEYEQLIGQLENVLEKKLIELKVEEEQHKELVLRYDGIVEKRTAIKH
ncbi:unnamed protein product [Paramecium pentaurelia]|uniref:Uncharacterized protein n=1 Tax=Paramecium pentaurelia TaxID=43138 RepID=A0A8S1VIQ8_9CILI|nr:unnamed protein product [Paramecium pentaurelia]